jgi:two-component system, cell cycle sensor histidine kinase and response regulator CckA
MPDNASVQQAPSCEMQDVPPASVSAGDPVLLLVEDNPADAELTSELLAEVPGYRYRLIVASRLEEALGVLKREPVHAVILDLNLPDSTGMETLDRVRAADSEVPVVVLSGADRPGADGDADAPVSGEDFIGKNESSGRLLARSLLYSLERLRAQESNRQVERVLAANPDAVVVADIEGNVRYVNDAARELLGEDCSELVAELLGCTVGEGAPAPIEVIKGKELRQAEMRVVPMEWDGKPAYLASVRDVTDRRRMEAQLAQAQKMESLGQLTGGIAHDFNNILQIILGRSELMEELLEEDAPMRKHAGSIRQATERGATLIRRLLAFARRQPLKLSSVDVNRLISQLDVLGRRTLGEDIEMRTVLTPGLAPATCDDSQLESAILNLCVNARDAMPNGGRLLIETGSLRIDKGAGALLAELSPGEYIQIAVSDTGTGMTPEVVREAFEPFFTTKEPGKGTGLGLSMVYGLMKQLGGTARIYSEVGVGTTIKLFLPAADTVSVTAAPPGQETSMKGNGETILVVEDDDMVRESVSDQLAALDYHVVSAINGPEALDILAGEGPIDLLFTDVIMPGGLNGSQLADLARAQRPDIRVLFTSGYTERAAVFTEKLPEGAELLSKPYRGEELARRIRDVLVRPTKAQT